MGRHETHATGRWMASWDTSETAIQSWNVWTIANNILMHHVMHLMPLAGHERVDVVARRKEYVEYICKTLQYSVRAAPDCDTEGDPFLSNIRMENGLRYVHFWHDESFNHVMAQLTRQWQCADWAVS